jgi:Prophage CP4-57 regulatory protein (AlpA)
LPGFSEARRQEACINRSKQMLSRQFRYRDLEEHGVVTNRVQLTKLIRTQGFPPGRMLSPNCRVWDEGEIAEWLASRPTVSATPLKGGAKLRQERARSREAAA